MGKPLYPPTFCSKCGGKVPFERHSNRKYCSRACEKFCEGYETRGEQGLVTLANKVAATTAWKPADLDSPLHIVAQKIGVISDVHCPLHSEKWLYKAIETFLHFDIKHVLINGDLLDATQISRHNGEYKRRGTLEDDLMAAEAVLKLLSEHFDYLYLDFSNHDQRLIRQFGGELSFQRACKLFGEHEKLKITSRSYCLVNDHVEVVHPRQYSKARTKLPQDLALRWQKSVLTGHQHHSGMSVSPCGKFQACDIGTLADVELQDYVRNERTTHSEPVNGFAIIFGNKIQCFDRFTCWEAFGLPAMEG
jgi:predicted phosphodiesterase